MSKNCDGANEVANEKSTESEEASKSPITGDLPVPKKILLESGFRGFVSIPYVRLERYDITPYLNGRKRRVIHRKIEKNRGKYDAAHKERLSQKCLVKLQRDDLEKLLASHRSKLEESSSSDSDSDSPISPDMLKKCKICSKGYCSDKKLIKHLEKKHIIYTTRNAKPQKHVSFSDHVIVHEVKAYHKCRKCPQIFENYNALKLHTKQWHKKRKSYICDYCNKNFIDRMFFKVHIRMHCDMCGNLLPNRSKYLEHRRDVCRSFKIHKCETCDASFYKIMDLKDHGYDHLDTCFICDVCKDQFQTKCAIAHHYSFLHSKKRPKEMYVMRKMGMERLYLCKFCEVSSVERDVVERHILKLPDLTNKATTGYKDYYFCDQCMRKFDTETAMLQHKWSHFLKTSDNSQMRPKSILTKRKPEIKTTYDVKEEIPEFMRPFVVLESFEDVCPKQYVDSVAVNVTEGSTINVNTLKKALVHPKSKKTLLSRHKCETCGKYFSSNYCLRRHIATQHEDFDGLRCKVCEETFVWPSLLMSHKCIRLNHPEMPFDDARAEILFDNLSNQHFDDLNIDECENYMNVVDFEIPAPAVELRECDSTFMAGQSGGVAPNESQLPDNNGVTSSGYKIVIHEVPIEF